MAKRKRKAAGKGGQAAAAGAFTAGQRVRIVRGDYGNSEGTVESAAGGKVKVHVHGRLTVTASAADVVAI